METLQKILVAILKVQPETARRTMDKIASGAIDSRVRGVGSLLEFATELEKATNFAAWQARIFLSGSTREEAITRYGFQAFQTFKRELKMVEQAMWNFIDEEEPEPLKKILARLRANISSAPAVTVLVAKAARRTNQESEEDELEEQPRKKKGATKTVAIVSEEEQQPQDMVVAMIGKMATSIDAMSTAIGNLQGHPGGQQFTGRVASGRAGGERISIKETEEPTSSKGIPKTHRGHPEIFKAGQ